jgi:putative SOS response-associated peptidase YedK
VTTAANTLVAPVHERMPVILAPEVEWAWLDPEADLHEAMSYLEPYPAELMAAAPASREVNSVRNDHPGLVTRDALAA